MRESFTKAEIVAVLDAAWRTGQQRLEADAITWRDERGWACCLAHLANEFGVSKEWQEYTPPDEARESI